LEFAGKAARVSGGELSVTRKQKERFDFDGESGNTVYFRLRYEK
jgi:hypothetical protein